MTTIDLATLVPLVNEFVDLANTAEDREHPEAMEVAIELMNDRAEGITDLLPNDAEWEPLFTGPWTTSGIEVTYEGAAVRITPVKKGLMARGTA